MTSNHPLTDAAEFYYPPADETKPLVMVVPAEFAQRMEEAIAAAAQILKEQQPQWSASCICTTCRALQTLTKALEPKR